RTRGVNSSRNRSLSDAVLHGFQQSALKPPSHNPAFVFPGVRPDFGAAIRWRIRVLDSGQHRKVMSGITDRSGSCGGTRQVPPQKFYGGSFVDILLYNVRVRCSRDARELIETWIYQKSFDFIFGQAGSP